MPSWNHEVSPKYEKDMEMYPKVQKCSFTCHSVDPGHPHFPKNIARPPKVALRPEVRPQGAKEHVQIARGRVLAEGDVDPAAGSRDEPTKLPVEDPAAERKQALRYK